MVPRLIRYPFGAVKARAMAGRVRHPSDLRSLMQTGRESVSGELFSRDPAEGMSPQRTLEEDYLRFAGRLASGLPARCADLIDTYLSRLDLENLKIVCRKWLLGRSDLGPNDLFFPSARKDALSPSSLLGAESLEDLTLAVPKGAVRKILLRRKGEGGRQRLSQIEAGLDHYFWRQMAASLAGLSFLDRSSAAEPFGWRAELDRFRIAVRGLREERPAREVVADLPVLGSSFGPEPVRRALGSQDPRKALGMLHPVSGLEDPLGDSGEAALVRRLRKRLLPVLRQPPVGPGPPAAALLLKELELEDLRGILAGLDLNQGGQEVDAWLEARGG